MIKVTYYYSACVGIKTKDVSILCDPWFTDGIYDGSWYQYPKLSNPAVTIGRYDIIYVSHIHPDHYDSTFLREYIKSYPDTKIVIAPFKNNYLSKKMTTDGFTHQIVDALSIGSTHIKLIPNELATNLVLKGAYKGYVHDVSLDFKIWENKIYIDPPILAKGDGPVTQYRMWAQQFYYNDSIQPNYTT